MTPETLEYLLRLTVIWSVLLAYYFFALRQTSFRFQRFYLLGGLLFGVVVPLLPALAGAGLPVASLPALDFTAPGFVVRPDVAVAETGWAWAGVLPWLYALGAAFFGARTLVQWKVLWQWLTTGTRSEYLGYRLIRHQSIPAPFVAFGWIFLPAEMPDAGLENTALIHEAAHLRSRHHYDTLLLTLGSLLLWFHPLFWVYHRQLATVHEYEADAAVIQTIPVRTYGFQLLQASLGPAGYPGLFSSPLKHRIDMITKNNRARKLRLFPLLTLCLLLLGLVVACSDVAEDIQSPRTEAIPGLEYIVGDPADVVTPDEYPKPSGMEDKPPTWENLIRGFYQEIRYPAAARESGKTGFVRLLVDISEKGDVTGITTIGLDPSEDEDPSNNLVVVGYTEADKVVQDPTAAPFTQELNRMVNALAPFTPAQLEGKSIATRIAFDVEFKLE